MFADIVRYLPLMGLSIFHMVVGGSLGYSASIFFKLPAPESYFVVLMNGFNNK
jgi:hypothetical protein